GVRPQHRRAGPAAAPQARERPQRARADQDGARRGVRLFIAGRGQVIPGARLALFTIVALMAAGLAALSQEPDASRTAEPIAPIPVAAAVDAAKVRLGERLFRDVRLSQDNKFACASCHRLDQDGDDGRVRSSGADGRPLDFNTPTVFNAALSFRLNWRGNFRTLEEQAEAALLDPRLMATSWEALIAKLRADRTYRDPFDSAYRQPPERPPVPHAPLPL